MRQHGHFCEVVFSISHTVIGLKIKIRIVFFISFAGVGNHEKSAGEHMVRIESHFHIFIPSIAMGQNMFGDEGFFLMVNPILHQHQNMK